MTPETVDTRTSDTGGADAAVVVPIIDAASSAACLRSLGRRGIPTVAVSAQETAPALRSKFCDELVGTPDPNDDVEVYAEALLSLAARSDVRTIIPVREEDVYVLAKRKSAFTDHVATPWPDLETLRKLQFLYI